MADDELAFMKAQVSTLSNLPVTLSDDYLPSPDDLPRKFTPFPVELPPPPVVTSASAVSDTQSSITLTIKSLKPAVSFTLKAHPTDTIASIKEQLASKHGRAPPVDVQRLLIKGKVLADNKLLKEYDAVVDGTVLNLMVKPGTVWTGEDKIGVTVGSRSGLGGTTSPVAPPAALEAIAAANSRRHSRTPSEGGQADQFPVPSLVIEGPSSPTSSRSGPKRAPVPLSIDIDALPSRPSSPLSSDTNKYTQTITSTAFWEHLRDFLGREFGSEGDGDAAFEAFLLASKGSLSAGDIARIRDTVQVTGMAGV